MREIHKLEAALPAGQKLDPGKAPRIPDLIDSTYFLDNEVFILMDIQRAEIEKDMTDRNKAKGSGK
jgi:hypothetical protein